MWIDKTRRCGTLFLRYTALETQIFVEVVCRMSVNTEEAPLLAANDNDFQSLEEKVYRTIELLKSAREAKAAAERDNARLREQLETREEELDGARNELITLRKEREEVRGRVEKLLKQIDTLTSEEATA